MATLSEEKPSTTASPLNAALLSQLPATVAVPRYDRSRVVPRIVHIGLGGFHRAHQAVYLDDLLNQGATDWGICGLGVLEQDQAMRQALASQDFLYTLVERSPQADQARVIGSIRDMMLGFQDQEKTLARLAGPETAIISLTVTEKGYFHDPATGRLNDKHPAIVNDLAAGAKLQTAIGFIVESLQRRFAGDKTPVTILSCDNLLGNGDVAKDVILSFATLKYPKLAAWIEESIAFPNTMVDRITPVTTPKEKAMVAEKYGIQDQWPIVSESFRQWIVEDHFAAGRPAWEKAGAELLDDVKPYEHMKVRLLNGGHSALAYLGYLLGHRLVDRATNDPLITRFLQRLMDEEVTPTLLPLPRVDLAEYKATLIARFGNPSIQDQVQRLAMDGSQKLPNNLIACVRDQVKAGRPVRLLALALAGWIRYLRGTDEQGAPIEITDPIASQLVSAAQSADPARAVLGIKQVFGDDLPQAQPFVRELAAALDSLNQRGTQATLSHYLS
ncbi:MAG: mannitol dehydrogenase family protein [Verrucomicrobium sp.]|nr:mannitol dehydrogenase family protein [Verrucomicrobium sp.]